MSEHLTRYFTAANRLRRSERSLVRSGALLDLETLRSENLHPRLRAKVDTLFTEELAKKLKAKAS